MLMEAGASQAIRQFTLMGLKDGDLVLAIEIDERSQAIQLEDMLRRHYGENLTMDLSVPTSWVAQMMQDWRRQR